MVIKKKKVTKKRERPKYEDRFIRIEKDLKYINKELRELKMLLQKVATSKKTKKKSTAKKKTAKKSTTKSKKTRKR